MSVLLDSARSQAQLYASKQLYNTAIFWADKALSLSGGDANDLATFCSCLHASGQHRRAIHALLSSAHLSKSAGLRYLAAKCYVAVQEWTEALLILKPSSDDHGLEGDSELTDSVKVLQFGDVVAASLLLQGQAHEGLGSLQVLAERLVVREMLRHKRTNYVAAYRANVLNTYVLIRCCGTGVYTKYAVLMRYKRSGVTLFINIITK